MEPAILPEELIEPEPRLLKELSNGEKSYIPYLEMEVRSDRTCFLNVEAKLRDKGRNRIEVRREQDGSFHVVVPSNLSYRPGEIKLSASQPVASITIGKPVG